MLINEVLSKEETGYMMLFDVKDALRKKNYNLLIGALGNRLPPSTEIRKVLIPILQKNKKLIIKGILEFMKGSDDYDRYGAFYYLPDAVMILMRLHLNWPELDIIYKSMRAEPNRYKRYPGQQIDWIEPGEY
jgi:hypothetical protein